MTVAAGTRLGVYEVAAPLGSGGMGDVYRARDTTLNRDVAIKVLPDAFVADRDRLSRFTREAQTLAALNHPNVAHSYGVIEYGVIEAAPESPRAIVMELVEGEGLDQRLVRGRLTLRDALTIARPIADGVVAAYNARDTQHNLRGNLAVVDAPTHAFPRRGGLVRSAAVAWPRHSQLAAHRASLIALRSSLCGNETVVAAQS